MVGCRVALRDIDILQSSWPARATALVVFSRLLHRQVQLPLSSGRFCGQHGNLALRRYWGSVGAHNGHMATLCINDARVLRQLLLVVVRSFENIL